MHREGGPCALRRDWEFWKHRGTENTEIRFVQTGRPSVNSVLLCFTKSYRTRPTKVVFRFHEPEALADFCNRKELGWRLRITIIGRDASLVPSDASHQLPFDG